MLPLSGEKKPPSLKSFHQYDKIKKEVWSMVSLSRLREIKDLFPV